MSANLDATALVVLAAGGGRRYQGLKQLAPIGPHGESIIEYSIYDGLASGFDRPLFVAQPAGVDDTLYVVEQRIAGPPRTGQIVALNLGTLEQSSFLQISGVSDSFEGEVTPLLVDVDGSVVQLTGSAEVQFNQWRKLLQEIAEADAPLPADINLVSMAPAETVNP